MSPGATFERVYLALKGQLLRGRFRPGDHLEPAAIGEDLNASITPVRDALHRLVGERLVEAPRGDGFRIPYVTEIGLRHLYQWNRDLLQLAIMRARLTPRPDASDVAADATAATLFLEIARLSENPEHPAAVAMANDRLAIPRLAEARLLDEPGEELHDLAQAVAAADHKHMRLLVAAYHRHRVKAVPQIVALLQSSP